MPQITEFTFKTDKEFNSFTIPDTGIIKVFVEETQVTYWYLNKQRHREDGPAIYDNNGNEVYYKNGILHREDGPAYVMNQNKKYYVNGVKHRDDGPAIERANGEYSYYVNGLLHREDGPADYIVSGIIAGTYFYRNGNKHRDDGPAFVGNNGEQEWYIDDLLHREDGPAFIDAYGQEFYYINGKRHREDGPAGIMCNGVLNLYYVNDTRYYTKEKFDARVAVKDMTIEEIEDKLGHKINIIDKQV